MAQHYFDIFKIQKWFVLAIVVFVVSIKEHILGTARVVNLIKTKTTNAARHNETMLLITNVFNPHGNRIDVCSRWFKHKN